MLTTNQKIALARLASGFVTACRKVAGKPPSGEFVRDGIRWKLDLREGIDFSLFLLGQFEPATVRAYKALVRPGQVVLDIGANVGAHTLPLARLVGRAGRVYAFEPTAFAYRKLLDNLALNPELAPQVLAQQVMLVADESAPLQAAVYSSWPLENTGVVHPKHRGRLMDTTGARPLTLDCVLEEIRPDRIDLIKLDVDGNELPVLRGGSNALAKYRPAIAMELAPYIHEEQGHSFEELIRLLASLGYVFRELGSNRALPEAPDELRAMVPDGAGINILAVSG